MSAVQFVPPYVGSIDQGTSSTRFLLFDANGAIVASHQTPLPNYYPKPGWAEQDADEIYATVVLCMNQVVAQANERYGITAAQIKGIGITNQRETTVIWDKSSDKPLHRTIVWLDTRNKELCSEAEHQFGREHFRSRCGLPISTYFSALKIRWLIDNVEAVRIACEQRTCLFGTIDTWLIWKLSGGKAHVTDVTNASRTMLMNLESLHWDEQICTALRIPLHILPKICSSSEIYTTVASGALSGVPIASCLGDQHAALLGQRCLSAGEAKNTYGTGCFILLNTGNRPVESMHGLLTTLAFKLGPTAPAIYALEGSVAIAGAGISWLVKNLDIMKSPSEIGALAESVENSGGVCFVPAFAGLFAPYWRSDARGIIVGLTQATTKAHIARATLDAIAFQTCEVLEAMEKDSGVKIRELKVDGGVTACVPLLYIQADLLGTTVVCPENYEATALGAAYATGLAVGVYTLEKIANIKREEKRYESTMIAETRLRMIKRWKLAIEKSLGWADIAL